MQIMPRDLEMAIENSKKPNKKKINLLSVLQRLNISPRDLYYESEARFILDNLNLYVDTEEEISIIEVLNNEESLESIIIEEIVDLTTNYESPVKNEDFIEDALSIIRHYINTFIRSTV